MLPSRCRAQNSEIFNESWSRCEYFSPEPYDNLQHCAMTTECRLPEIHQFAWYYQKSERWNGWRKKYQNTTTSTLFFESPHGWIINFFLRVTNVCNVWQSLGLEMNYNLIEISDLVNRAENCRSFEVLFAFVSQFWGFNSLPKHHAGLDLILRVIFDFSNVDSGYRDVFSLLS